MAIDQHTRITSRQRRDQAGAALVEALVAIPFFITIFATTMFLGDFYKTEARYAATI